MLLKYRPQDKSIFKGHILFVNLHVSSSLPKRGALYGAQLQGEWKGINCKQIARWQHLSRLKASAFFSLQKKI